jgi:UDP-N-acetylglucosamine--N-acetylmuramyl-(pentapeptide) pyrophosphoryl-undecaprenol N-acetylglucosamine transferase
MGASSMGTVLILAGGTGGHVYPALAVALELQQRGFHIRWLGTERGLESRVVVAAGLALDFIQVRGLRGKGMLARLQGALVLLWAAVQSLVAVASIRPVCVLGMGGYVSGPAGMAAWLLRRPLVIHEQNSVAGTTNRLLSKFASRILAAYPTAFGERAELVGNPVRSELLAAGEATHYDYDGERPLRLFVVGGSLGALAINEVVPDALAMMAHTTTLIVKHQTGVDHADTVTASHSRLGNAHVEVLPYVEDMAAIYKWADLVLCRAGALTVAELSIMSRPSILVPLPDAIDNHQFHNAQWLADCGGALLMPQSELTPQLLSECLTDLLARPQQLAEMAIAARVAAFPLATQRVAEVCQEVRLG